jgi:hypothetical protein
MPQDQKRLNEPYHRTLPPAGECLNFSAEKRVWPQVPGGTPSIVEGLVLGMAVLAPV